MNAVFLMGCAAGNQVVRMDPRGTLEEVFDEGSCISKETIIQGILVKDQLHNFPETKSTLSLTLLYHFNS